MIIGAPSPARVSGGSGGSAWRERTRTTRRSASASAPGAASGSAFSVSRGGASPPATHAVGGGGGSDPAANFLGSMWESASSLARSRVGPALRDPRGRLIRPIGRYLEDKAAEARDRRAREAEGRRKNGAAVAGAAFGAKRAARMTLLAFLLAEALSVAGFFPEDKDGRNEDFDDYNFDAGGRRGGRFRGVRVSVGEWWDQARSPGGIFHGRTWEDRFIIGNAFREDVVRPLQTRYASLPDKSKFAIGASAGMTASPSLYALGALTGAAVRWTAAAYILAEVTAALGRGRRRRSRPVRVDDLVDTTRLRKFAREYELDDEMDDAIRAANKGLRGMAGRAARDGFDILEDALEDVRRMVRRAARDPGGVVDRAVIWIDENREAASGAALGSVLGLLL